ncbi:hypothetical protein D3C76_1245920 [compost metagenome]
MFGVEIERFKLGVLRHLQGKGICFRLGEAVGAGVKVRHAALLRVLPAVELQAAFGVNPLRVAVQPEVHQVKMVGGFMYQQAAAVAFFPMPAAEVVCAMFGVEQPFEVHRSDLANRPLHQQLAHLAVVRGVAVVEGHAHAAAGLFDGVENAQGALFIDGHRLFGDHIAAGVQGANDVVVMGTIHGGDDNYIRARLADHLFKLRRLPGGNRGRPFVF